MTGTATDLLSGAARFAAIREEIEFARAEVPLLRAHLERAGVDSCRLRSPEDLCALPPTTRADYRAAGRDALARAALASGRALVTSFSAGTSGGERVASWADPVTLTERMDALVDVRPSLRDAIDGMRGRGPIRIAPRACSDLDWDRAPPERGPRYLPDGTAVLDLSERPWTAPADVLRRAWRELELASRAASWLYADPACLALLAAHRGALRPPLALDAVVFTYSPCLLPARSLVERTFSATGCFADVLASSELGWTGIECPAGSIHLNADAFHLEVLPLDTRLPAAPGAVGELLVTTVGDRVAPRLRYATGDLVALDARPCRCGHAFPAARPHGRLADCVAGAGGRLVTPRQIDDAVGAAPGLVLYQLEQVGRAAFRFHCIAEDGGRAELAGRVSDGLREVLGGEAEIQVALDFRRLASGRGKLRSCVPMRRSTEGPGG